jgi:hypothetical protein
MNQEDAKRQIIREWRAPPSDQRQTDEQAAFFAMQIKAQIQIQRVRRRSVSIKGWLERHLSLARGLD